MPKRIQRKRTKGWRMPENTVYVGRPTMWGNPYKADGNAAERDLAAKRYRWWLDCCLHYRRTGKFIGWVEESRVGQVVPLYAGRTIRMEPSDPTQWSDVKDMLRIVDALSSLKGKNLACWCPAGHACHADVLLELANAAQ
ncbi:MAG: DUF4326 domain-containing protein [Salinibacterium sp.]|nr:MAG: DUF4326 domain-containing protein [Salinibacterium sp.]